MSELFPQTASEYTLDRVARALSEELPEAETEGLRARAEALCAIADSLAIPFEALIRWAHYRAPNKEWSQAEFRRWATSYAADMKALPVPAAELEGAGEPPPAAPWEPSPCAYCGEAILTDAAAAAHVCHMICTRCFAHSAQRVNGRWICANCGEVR